MVLPRIVAFIVRRKERTKVSCIATGLALIAVRNFFLWESVTLTDRQCVYAMKALRTLEKFLSDFSAHRNKLPITPLISPRLFLAKGVVTGDFARN
jgi:hypothetical protein